MYHTYKATFQNDEWSENMMYIVFTAQNVPYLKTLDEVEADTMAYQIGGYYVERRAY